MRSLLSLLIWACVVTPYQSAAAGQVISGIATVSDGDSLKINQKRIRLLVLMRWKKIKHVRMKMVIFGPAVLLPRRN